MGYIIFKNKGFDIFAACVLGALLGSVSVFFSPLLVLILLAAISSTILLLRFPEFGVIGFIVLTSTVFNFNIMPSVSIGIGRIYLSDLIIFGFLSATVLSLLNKSGSEIKHSPLSLPLFFFLCIALIATFTQILQSNLTLQQVLGEVRRILNYLFFFIVIYLCYKKDQIKRIYNGLILAASIVALLMIVQFIVGTSVQLLPGRIEILSTEGTTDPAATRIIPPGYPLVTITFILLSASLILGNYRGYRTGRYIQLILIGIGVLLTYKRHLWLVIVLSIFFLLLIVGWEKRIKLVYQVQLLFALVVIGSIFLSVSVPDSKATAFISSVANRANSLLRSETYNEQSSLKWRDFEYRYALTQIISHPILGLGLGAAYRPLVPYRDHENYDGRTFIHNGLIWLMVKTGLLGYLCFFMLSAAFLYRGFTHWRYGDDPHLQTIAMGSTIAYLALFLGSMIEPMIIEWDATALLAVLMGMRETLLLYHSREMQ